MDPPWIAFVRRGMSMQTNEDCRKKVVIRKYYDEQRCNAWSRTVSNLFPPPQLCTNRFHRICFGPRSTRCFSDGHAHKIKDETYMVGFKSSSYLKRVRNDVVFYYRDYCRRVVLIS